MEILEYASYALIGLGIIGIMCIFYGFASQIEWVVYVSMTGTVIILAFLAGIFSGMDKIKEEVKEPDTIVAYVEEYREGQYKVYEVVKYDK